MFQLSFHQSFNKCMPIKNLIILLFFKMRQNALIQKSIKHETFHKPFSKTSKYPKVEPTL